MSDALIEYIDFFSTIAEKVEIEHRVVVYTAIFDGYDSLDEINCSRDSIDYVCFTNDGQIRSKTWQIVHVESYYRDPRRTARLFKLLPHLLFPSYEKTLWIDGSCAIKSSVGRFIDDFGSSNSLVLFEHPERSCVYKEAEACIMHAKDDPLIIADQMNRYSECGFPKQAGMVATGIILRSNRDPLVQELMQEWAGEIDRSSSRDQLSFPFCAWKLGVSYGVLPFNLYDNPYFEFGAHKKFVFYDGTGQIIRSVRALLSRLYYRLRAGF